MHANAVITINISGKIFKFQLVDALGNVCIETSDLNILAYNIEKFYKWSKGSKRVATNMKTFKEDDICKINIPDLLKIVRTVADKVELERGGRYFGNVSTRCSKMFPSQRIKDDIILVSARNTPKDRLTNDDFVFTKLIDDKVYFHGGTKPSVDNPIQLNLYKEFKNINFMIHGHAYIKGATETHKYYPCGDLRELYEIKKLLKKDSKIFVLNLKNHGFIIGTKYLTDMKDFINICKFEYKTI